MRISPRTWQLLVPALLLAVWLCWALPTTTSIDVGAYDAPWVSDTYNVQSDGGATYRWTYPQGTVQLFAMSGGTFQLDGILRTTQQTRVQVVVDDVPVTTWQVGQNWATYTTTVTLPMQWDGAAVVSLRCLDETFDGKRPACVAIDQLRWTPVGWYWPSVWAALLVMVVWAGMWLLRLRPIAVGLVIIMMAIGSLWAREFVAMTTPYAIVLIGATVVIGYAQRYPMHRGWQFAQMSVAMLVLVTIRYAMYGSVGLMLEDEGYLWYGSQRVVLGELPVRDFFGYDVPRYWWNALVMLVLGRTDIGALRIALALCEWLVLVLAGAWAMLVRIPWRSWMFGVLLVLVVTWLGPRHKLYDHVTIWLLLIAGERYLQLPSMRRAWWLGVIIGVVAMIGRNHGLYGACVGGMLLLVVWAQPQAWRQRIVQAGWCAAGVVVGFLPTILIMVLDARFGQEYVRNTIAIVTRGNVNMPLPIAWPWLAPSGDQLLRSLWYVFPIVLYCSVACWLLYQRWRGTTRSVSWIAPIIVGVPYVHVWTSRAELGHLAQSIAPALALSVLIIGVFTPRWRVGVAMGMCVWSLWVSTVAPWQASWLARSKTQQEVTVGMQQLTVPNGVAANLRLLRAVHAQYAPDGGAFMVAPYWPGAYALYQQPAPQYYSYLLFRYDSATQQREIAGIQRYQPRFILIDDRFIDGNPQWHFGMFMPELDAYITTHYRRVNEANIPDTMRLYVP